MKWFLSQSFELRNLLRLSEASFSFTPRACFYFFALICSCVKRIVRRSPPRHSPPQTFTTSDVHHPLCKIRRSPPQTFTTSDVHHLRRSPPQTFTTPSVKSDVHHPRHSPPPIPKCDIHQGCLDCRNILNAWTVGEFSFGGDDCRGWWMLVGGECCILE